jgi:Peptidase A4 family
MRPSRVEAGARWLAAPAMLAALTLAASTDVPAVKGAMNAKAATHLAQARMYRWRDAKGLPLSGPSNETLSTNWAGYAMSGDTYTAVQGTWVVPQVSYQAYPGSPDVEASSTWIGIGGQDGDQTLIQIGTMQAADPSGDTEYFAWYEILPATEVPISRKQYPIKPGDTINATIECTAGCRPNVQATWVLTLSNANRWANPYTITVPYTSSLSSVEWIVEGPCLKNCESSEPGFAYLPNYGSTTFTSISVNNANPNLSRRPNGIIMRDPNGNATSMPSDPIGGNSFTVNFAI